MYREKFFASRYYPGDILVMGLPIGWGIALAFIKEYAPASIARPIAQTILFLDIIAYLLLLATWFFEGFKKEELEKEIQKAEYKFKHNKYDGDPDDIIIMKEGLGILNSTHRSHIHILKSHENIADQSSVTFTIAFVVFMVCNLVAFRSLIPFGIITFLIIVSVTSLITIWLIAAEIKSNGIHGRGALIGKSFMLGVFFYGFYVIYSVNFGENKVGSFFEKPDYTAKYYVNLFENKNHAKNYRLIADVHVFSTSEQDGEDSYSEKHIVLERVYWPNGGYTEFDQCELQPEKVESCTDDDGRVWYIEFTNIQPN